MIVPLMLGHLSRSTGLSVYRISY